MRTPLFALLCGALASLLFAGTATAGTSVPSAPPKGKAVLVANPIYKTGALQLQPCQEQPVQRDDLDGSRVYLMFVLDCLNASWEPQFAKAKIPFVKPKFSVVSAPGKPTPCGKFPEGAQAFYCPEKKAIVFLLDKNILSVPDDLFLMNVMSHEYGHHVQNITGMFRALTKATAKSVRTKRYLAESRRVELQAECFGGVFIGSIWHSLGRRDFDFKYIVKVAQSGYDYVSHGKAANIAHWLKKGFDSESPGACNTWAAPANRVS